MRVVLEKPLGHDLASAREINRVVRSAFREEQAFRIDHYLGKPAVQNLMALRFGNALFEPLWRRESIANIQITLAEAIGVGTRGDFYDRTGALRDMVQNHALQLLTMVAMEPPSRNDADAIRDEKLKVLRSLKPFTPESVARDVVRGQYRAGNVDGKPVPGYLEEDKVPAGSRTETFVALRTEVQNWRWAGVPFYLRTGKRLAARDAQIVVNFRPTPHTIFPGREPGRTSWSSSCSRRTASSCTCSRPRAPGQSRGAGAGVARPRLRQGLRREPGRRLRAAAARRRSPAASTCSCAATSRRKPGPGSSRSSRPGRRDDAGPRPYAAGTWGPAAASALVARDGYAWAEEAVAASAPRAQGRPAATTAGPGCESRPAFAPVQGRSRGATFGGAPGRPRHSRRPERAAGRPASARCCRRGRDGASRRAQGARRDEGADRGQPDVAAGRVAERTSPRWV